MVRHYKNAYASDDYVVRTVRTRLMIDDDFRNWELEFLRKLRKAKSMKRSPFGLRKIPPAHFCLGLCTSEERCASFVYIERS